jgi:hypothetical protein
LLTVAAAASALLYAPFLRAAEPEISVRTAFAAFPAGNAAAVAILAVLGLIASDRAGVPMPLLRRWETGRREAHAPALSLAATAAWSVPAALFSVWAAQHAGLPSNPGSLPVRLATTPFAAINLQIAIYLLLGGVVFLVIRRRLVVALLLGAALAGFHALGASAFDAELAWTMALNGGLGAVIGWLHFRHGVEYGALGHAIAHAVAVGFM